MDTLVDEKQNHTKGRGTPCESMAIHPSYGLNSKAVTTSEDGLHSGTKSSHMFAVCGVPARPGDGSSGG